MVLHTWNQQLGPHFHVHCVIPAGALSADGKRWIPGDPKYLFPVRALSVVFRGKFMAALQRAFTKGELGFFGTAEVDGTPEGFANLVQRLRTIDWYFRLRGRLIHKYCTFFLMVSYSGDPVPEVAEGITECQWLPLLEAIDVVDYENAREVVRDAARLALDPDQPLEVEL